MESLSSLGLFGDILRVIIIAIEVLLVFNFMILIHEWGHFLAARWRGLHIEKFQIWFGKPLWSKTINGVQYGLGSIPAGGFVALPQMAPMDAIEGGSADAKPLPPISPLDKIIVAFAGPLFSFSLAVVFAWIVYGVGKPESEANTTTTIGVMMKDGPAAKAGLKIGDKILEINGQKVRRFMGPVDSVNWFVVSSNSNEILFNVERPGAGPMSIPVQAEKPTEDTPAWWKTLIQRPSFRMVGIGGKSTPMVAKLMPNSPAAAAGIKANDIILSLDGVEVLSNLHFKELAEKANGKPMVVGLLRGKEKLSVTLTARTPDEHPAEDAEKKIGIVWDLDGVRTINYPTPREQISDASRAMKNTIGAIVTKGSGVSASHLSGPVGIFRVYYTLFQEANGWRLVLWFSVLLNVNLAIMNMLPFPVLDGGHITMALMEIIRRKPLNLRVLEFVQTGCVLLLLCFFLFVTMKDVGDWGTSVFSAKKEAPIYRFYSADELAKKGGSSVQ
jgi:regulator of sigma E protease